MITPMALEAEWLGNLQQFRHQTIQQLTDWMIKTVMKGPTNPFYESMALLATHQMLKRNRARRYFLPLMAFAWWQAILATAPARIESFAGALERGVAGLPGHGHRQVERFRHDLDFCKLITDQFAETGFLSVALHVVQRVHGEIEQHPNNLVSAVGLTQWMEEQYQFYLDYLTQVEIMSG